MLFRRSPSVTDTALIVATQCATPTGLEAPCPALLQDRTQGDDVVTDNAVYPKLEKPPYLLGIVYGPDMDGELQGMRVLQ
jgi:hypothetical protein